MTVNEAAPEAPPVADAVSRPGFERVPALDGIRAIAIASVLLFHNYLHSSGAWSGGFLGVDLFFVLSGFLITTLLLRERRAAGRINFRAFWSRRARRLLPAVFVLVLGEAVLARYVFDSLTASQLRGDGVGTLLYFENWRLAFGPSIGISHTWSLSVEEQWYLVWPLLLSLFFVLSRRTRALFALISVAAIASAVECALLFHAAVADVAVSNRAYYGTDTRAQELLVGAALAVILMSRPRNGSRVLQLCGWMALAFFVWNVGHAHVGAAWLYRGGFLVIALGAAVLVAAVVQAPDALLARMFATRPLVAVGLVSYGLYLYHVPIFDWLTSDTTHLDGIQLLVVRVGATGAAAAMSYYLVERPFRRGARLDGKRVVALVIGFGVALSALIVATPPAVLPPPDLATYALSIAAHKTPPGVRRVLVAGDSSAFILALNGMFNSASVRGGAYGVIGCDLVAGNTVADDGTLVAVTVPCAHIYAKIERATRAYSPAIAVLMLGTSEARDRVIDSQTVRVGSTRFADLIVGAIDRARAKLTSTGAYFVLLPIQCDSISEVDTSTVSWLNRVLSQYAKDHLGTRFLASDDTSRCTRSTWPQIVSAAF